MPRPYASLLPRQIIDIDSNERDDQSRTSAILNYCKKKILHPYLRLLSVIGLRPVCQDLAPEQTSFYCKTFLDYIYFLVVLFLLIGGYILQSLSCFRRDRGFCFKTTFRISQENCRDICYGSIIFSYLIPNFLHLTAYLYAVYLFRIKDNEQLQNLMERAFLMATSNSDALTHQRHLMRRLWLFILLSLLWIALSIAVLSVMMAKENIVFLWFEKSSYEWITTLKVLLMIGTTSHDLVNVTIITSYFLQVQLLISYLHSLKLKLLENSISSLDWLRAARLTSSCKTLRQLGHEVRGRPFVYVDTPGDDLDTILLYTSSLRMTAKLYEIPISGRFISICLTLSSVLLLTLGQCHLL